MPGLLFHRQLEVNSVIAVSNREHNRPPRAWNSSPSEYTTAQILTATYQSHVKHFPDLTYYQLNRERVTPVQGREPGMAQFTRLFRPGFAAYKQQLEHIEKRGACYRVYVTRPDIKLGSVWVVQTNLAWT